MSTINWKDFVQRALPAILRPGFYAGPQGWRTKDRWVIDAISAILDDNEGNNLNKIKVSEIGNG